MSLTTRQPTGRPPWPILLLAGGEKAGKSYAAAQASASDLIGRSFWIGIGEDDPDEYGALPGARFEIAPHNGTYKDILAKLEEAVKEPSEDGKENLIIIDSGTRLWEMLSDEANARARSRAQAKAQRYNRSFSTDDEVTIGPDLWNRATDRWQDVMDLLRLHSGPSLITARLDVVMVMDANGNPTKDKTSKVKAQKSLPFDVGGIVEMPARGETYISGIRSLKLDLPVGEKSPVKDFSVDWLWRQLGLDQVDATSPRQHSGADGQASAAVPDGEPQAPPTHVDPNDAGAAALAQRRHPTLQPWDIDQANRAIKFAAGNTDTLRAAWTEAKAAGSPANVLELIQFAATPTPPEDAPVEGKLVDA